MSACFIFYVLFFFLILSFLIWKIFFWCRILDFFLVCLLIDVLSYGFGIFGSILSFWLSVFSIGWKCVVFYYHYYQYWLLFIVIDCFFVLIVVFFVIPFLLFIVIVRVYVCRFSGHSDGVIPGLVSIPEVKSVTFCLVLWRYLWEFHFAASLFFILFCITLLYCFLCFFCLDILCFLIK